MRNFLSVRTSKRYLPSILSGVLLGLSYPSYPYVHLEPLAWISLAPLLLSLREVRSLPRFLSRVYLASFITCVFGMHWLLTSTGRGAVILFFFGAVVFTVPFVAFYFIRRCFGWRTALFTMPVLWTAWEWLYQRSEGSFGWLGIGVTQSNFFWLVQYIDTTGVWGITFWLVLFNVLVVVAIEDWEQKRVSGSKLARRLVLTSSLMFAVPLAYSAYIFTRAARLTTNKDRELSVLLIQPNVNAWDKLSDSARPGILRKTIGLTNRALAAAATKPDLIIWPETAVPYTLADDKGAREAVYRGVERWQTPLLTGLWDRQNESGAAPPRLFNSAALLSPGSDASRRLKVESSAVYHKRALVPFVERVPFVETFPGLQRLAIQIGAGGTATPGSDATVFTLRTQRGAEVSVAAAICYDSLYSTDVADLVRNGAQMLAFITNEGWFSQSVGEYQLAAFSRLRSIETRRAVARTANTGITQLVDQYGRVNNAVPWWADATLQGNLQLSTETSFYVRHPDYLPRGCAWLVLALFTAALAKEAWQTARKVLRDRAPVYAR